MSQQGNRTVGAMVLEYSTVQMASVTAPWDATLYQNTPLRKVLYSNSPQEAEVYIFWLYFGYYGCYTPVKIRLTSLWNTPTVTHLDYKPFSFSDSIETRYIKVFRAGAIGPWFSGAMNNVQTCPLIHHRGGFTGAAVVTENIWRQLIIAGTHLSLHPIFHT